MEEQVHHGLRVRVVPLQIQYDPFGYPTAKLEWDGVQQLVLKNGSMDREYICISTCRYPAGKVKKGRPHYRTIASAPDFSLHFLTHYKGNCPDRLLLVGAKYFFSNFFYRGTQQKKSYRTENNLPVPLPLLFGTTTSSLCIWRQSLYCLATRDGFNGLQSSLHS